jgi:hypothetical protein
MFVIFNIKLRYVKFIIILYVGDNIELTKLQVLFNLSIVCVYHFSSYRYCIISVLKSRNGS